MPGPLRGTLSGIAPRAAVLAACGAYGRSWRLVRPLARFKDVTLKIRLFVKILKSNADVNTFR